MEAAPHRILWMKINAGNVEMEHHSESSQPSSLDLGPGWVKEKLWEVYCHSDSNHELSQQVKGSAPSVMYYKSGEECLHIVVTFVHHIVLA